MLKFDTWYKYDSENIRITFNIEMWVDNYYSINYFIPDKDAHWTIQHKNELKQTCHKTYCPLNLKQKHEIVARFFSQVG